MNFEKYNHTILHQNTPGSLWTPDLKDREILKPHTTAIGEMISDSHYDVFVRYGYAKARVEGKPELEFAFWKRLYEDMQRQRVGVARTKEFDNLIRSFEKNGFDQNFPIPVDVNYNMLDGAHRLACSAVFDTKPKISMHNTTSHDYSRGWFENQGFSKEELLQVDAIGDYLKQKYLELNNDINVGIVWGAALDYWEDILKILGVNNLKRLFIRDFKDKIQEFVKESYVGDGMQDDKIETKAGRLSEVSSKVGFVAFEGGNEKSILELKREVRLRISVMMDNYFFDNILHFIDNKEHGVSLLNKYSPQNNQ